MSPSSPKSCCSSDSIERPGRSANVLPPSLEAQAHDMLRVNVGEFGSGESASCQFSLCAVAKMSPKAVGVDGRLVTVAARRRHLDRRTELRAGAGREAGREP